MSPAPSSAIDNKLGHRAVRAWLQLRGRVFERKRTESVKLNSKNSRTRREHYTHQIEHRMSYQGTQKQGMATIPVLFPYVL